MNTGADTIPGRDAAVFLPLESFLDKRDLFRYMLMLAKGVVEFLNKIRVKV